MTPDDMDIWIKRYTDGNLNATEREAFEQQLLTDPQLKLQLEEYQRIVLLVKEKRLIDIKRMASRAEAKHEQRLLLKKLGLTALILAAITASVAIWYTTQKYEQSAQSKTIQPLKNKTTTQSLPNVAVPPKEDQSPKFKEKNNTEASEKIIPDHSVSVTDSVPIVENVVPQAINSEAKTKTFETKISNREATISHKTNTYDCSHTVITASFDMQPSCQNEPTGIISYRQPQGGQAPYTVHLYDALKNPMQLWSGLAAGKYYVLISDALQCNAWQQLDVDSKDCNNNHVFNPHLNETWEIPSKGKKGHLKIVDKKGNLYFSRNLTPSEIAIWDGKSNNGEIKTGYYLFYIQHEDNTLTSGSVTIIE